MTEAITSVAVSSPQESGASISTSKNGPGNASNYDMRDFSEAMTRNGAAPTQASISAAASPQAVSAPNGDGMKSFFSSFDHLNGSANKVEELARMVSAGNEMSPSQIVRLTMASHEFMFQSQLTSNVANRTSDGVQQLFRQQS